MKNDSNIIVRKVTSRDLGNGPISLKKLNCFFDEITISCNDINPSLIETYNLSNYLYLTYPQHKTLVILSHVSIKSTLLLKTFRFDIPYLLQNNCHVETILFDKYVYFIGFVSLSEQKHLEAAINFLYSGIIDSGNFILMSSKLNNYKEAIKQAVMIEFDRHKNIRGIRLNVDKLIESDGYSVMYPYGGVDFGCMVMYVVS